MSDICTPGSPLTSVPAAPPAEAAAHFERRLAVETDPADVAAAQRRGDGGVVLVDCRSREAFRSAHLPGAVSLPHGEMTAERVAELPDGLLVTYCWGPACNAATKGAARLAGHGRAVKEMIGGIEYWLREGHPTEGTARGGTGGDERVDRGRVV